MQKTKAIVHWSSSVTHLHVAQRLRNLGKSEEFLEEMIANHPELLGLESRRTSIYGPFVCFRQVSLTTPAGRIINPDVVILTASGHFIVVEVKLEDNPELRKRDVIAQIIDYASSFALLDDRQLVGLFDKSIEPLYWLEFIHRKFHLEEDPDELARIMRDRITGGEINLVIACDRVPPVIAEIVKGIAVQQSTNFSLDIVEITPFCAGETADEIIFVPSNRLSTEIVARTTVTVAYQGSAPDISVETTPIDEIKEKTKAFQNEASTARVWPPGEVDKVVREAGDPFEVQLLDFCKQYSSEGEFVSPAVKSNAAFGFFVVGRKTDGKRAKNMLFYLTHGWNALYLNLGVVKPLVDEATSAEFERRLKVCFGAQINVHAPAPSIKTDEVRIRIAEFKEIVLWFQEQVAARAVQLV